MRFGAATAKIKAAAGFIERLRPARPDPLSQPFAETLTRDGVAPTVLAFHGFGATPAELEVVLDAAADCGLAARAPLLPGHGTSVEELARLRFSDLYAFATEELRAAAERGPVICVGLSLGSLIAANLAIEHPDQVVGLGLLANALWITAPYPDWALWLVGALRLPDFRMPKGPPNIADPEARRTQRSYRINPVHIAVDIRRAGRRIQRQLHQVHVPTLILHGARDAVCPVSNAWRAAELLGTRDVKVTLLPRSAHVLTRDFDRDVVQLELAAFFARAAQSL